MPKLVFCRGSIPDPAGGAYNAPPHFLVSWRVGHPFLPQRLWRLDLGASVVWPPTSLKFVHLALRSKRLDTPAIEHQTLNHQLHSAQCTPHNCHFRTWPPFWP